MSAWRPPPISAAAGEAIATLEAPSRPGPLADSVRMGPASWRSDLAREDVKQAYLEPDAPVPPGSTVELTDGVLVIRAPFSTTCLLFSRASRGCIYTLLPGPTLRVAGAPAGTPSGEYFAPCGIDEANANTGKPQRSLIAAFKEGDQDWLVWVSENEQGARGKGMALLEPVSLAAASKDDDAIKNKATPATVASTERGLAASFKRGRATIRVEATRTHSLCGLIGTIEVPPPPVLDPNHRVLCVSKRSGGPMDQRVEAVGGTAGGKPWRLPVAELIARVGAGESFYIQEEDDDDAVPVTIDKGTSGSKYPLAKISGDRRNLVIGLPKCRKVANPVAPP